MLLIPLISCCSCINNPSSFKRQLNCLYLALEVITCVAWQYLVAPLQPHFPSLVCFLNLGVGNQEVYCSEQSVNECDLSLLLMIDSHHQQ